jgi:Flp pilus assembly protein TadG
MTRRKSIRGSALIETVLVIPLLLLFLLNLVNFGAYFYCWITVENAARAAVEYQSYQGAAPGTPSAPTFAQVQALINTDSSSLPGFNASVNPTLEICSNDSAGNKQCSAGTYVPPTEIEAGFKLYSADVTYSFTPIFPALVIPLLNVPLTIPAATIHRQAVMRSLQ